MRAINGKQIVTCAVFPLALICLVAGCHTDDRSPLEPQMIASAQTRAWVAIEPRQCLSNPWERDWLDQHGGDYAAYPRDLTTPGLEPEEIAIIRSYYARQGAVVFETAIAPKYTAVCMSCACPEGFTLFLLVREQDVDTMIGFGYRVEAPPATD